MSERLQTAIDVMDKHIDSRIAAYFSSCVHCGICAKACHFYVETGDPRYTPIYKLEPMRRVWREKYSFWGKLGLRLGLQKPLTEADLESWQELIYDSCTLCARCSMVCPVGNDIAYMVRKTREGMSAAGFAPDGLKGAADRSVNIGSPMGVTLKTLQAVIKNSERETSLEIPIDREGAHYLALMSSLEIVGFPEYLGSMARIFNQAGVSWTLSSEGFEATNSGIQIGNSRIAKELVGRIVAAAEKLKVKYVISPECGHAYTAIRWDAPNLIGRELPFKVVHILELLDQLRREGKLETEGAFDQALSFHDPCSLVRKGGVIEQPRHLLNMIAPEFKEAKSHAEMNWCCGGGGGVSAIEEAGDLRRHAFRRKKAQLEELEINTLVTACANCRNILEEGLEHYEMDEIEVVGVTELIAQYLKPQESQQAEQTAD